MPTVFRHEGFRFFFYSNEGNPREPVHIHVMKAGSEAKFWLEPDIVLESSNGFDARTLRKLIGIIEQNQNPIMEAWHGYFG